MKTFSDHNPFASAMRWTCLSLFLALAGGLAQPLSAQSLPSHGSANSSSTLWWITQLGLGSAGEFQISNSSNSNPALLGTTNGTGAGVQGVSNSAKGYGVNGKSANGTGGKFYGGQFGAYAEGGAYGLYAFGATGQGIVGESCAQNGYGGYFDDNNGNGVYGSSTSGDGGDFFGWVNGVTGISSSDYGAGVNGWGVYYGVYGQSTGTQTSAAGLGGYSANALGVFGQGGYAGIYGVGGSYAGYFVGAVHVTDMLTAAAKYFKIDHPLDPTNKYLMHACIESADMKNLYDGVVTTDANGDAVVDLPDWFEALNKDFRYQLTVIGQFAQAVIAQEIHNHQFAIKTDKPHVKVSWQVTGIRQDAYAKAHPLEVEQDKPGDKKGKFLHPREYGQSDERGEDYELRQRHISPPPAPAK